MELPLNGNDDKIVIALLTSIDATTRNMYELLKLKETVDIAEHINMKPFPRGRLESNSRAFTRQKRHAKLMKAVKARNKTMRKMILGSEFNTNIEINEYKNELARRKALATKSSAKPSVNNNVETLTHFKHNGKSYYRSSQNEIWLAGPGGTLGAWQGIYNPALNSIEPAPEPFLADE
jgi:hypothetical protein